MHQRVKSGCSTAPVRDSPCPFRSQARTKKKASGESQALGNYREQYVINIQPVLFQAVLYKQFSPKASFRSHVMLAMALCRNHFSHQTWPPQPSCTHWFHMNLSTGCFATGLEQLVLSSLATVCQQLGWRFWGKSCLGVNERICVASSLSQCSKYFSKEFIIVYLMLNNAHGLALSVALALSRHLSP